MQIANQMGPQGEQRICAESPQGFIAERLGIEQTLLNNPEEQQMMMQQMQQMMAQQAPPEAQEAPGVEEQMV